MNYYLVRFSDGIYHIVNDKQIKNRKDAHVSAKWKNNYYVAEIIAENYRVGKLQKLKKQTERKCLKDLLKLIRVMILYF